MFTAYRRALPRLPALCSDRLLRPQQLQVLPGGDTGTAGLLYRGGAVTLQLLQCRSCGTYGIICPPHLPRDTHTHTLTHAHTHMQYTARLNAEKLKHHIYKLSGGRVAKKWYNMRLAPEAASGGVPPGRRHAVGCF